jgi:multiple sugar transport system permease protein
MRRPLAASVLLYVSVVLACAILLFPVYWLVVTALSDPARLHELPPQFWVKAPRWDIFARVTSERPVFLWLTNSALAALGAVALSMVVSVLAAYSLSRFTVRGGQSLGLFVLTAKMLPATLLVIPLFGIFRSVGFIGDLRSVVFAHATLIIPFSTWMLKGYFDTIPRELDQAAMVDGCTPFGALFRIVLPVAAPGLAATALYGFVLSWSDYAYARTFLTSAQGAWTANLGLTTMQGEYITDWNEVAAVALIVALPVVVVYLFLERYLVGGLTAGSEK